jgi:hypothetical protein
MFLDTFRLHVLTDSLNQLDVVRYAVQDSRNLRNSGAKTDLSSVISPCIRCSTNRAFPVQHPKYLSEHTKSPSNLLHVSLPPPVLSQVIHGHSFEDESGFLVYVCGYPRTADVRRLASTPSTQRLSSLGQMSSHFSPSNLLYVNSEWLKFRRGVGYPS